MTKIFNGTPHSINIVDNGTFDPPIRKYTTDKPNVVISIPSNGMLSSDVQSVNLDPISVHGKKIIYGVDLNPINVIPVHGKRFVGVDPLPEGYDIYIVSQMYVSGVVSQGGDVTKLYTVSDPVYSLDGKTIHGCRGICPHITNQPIF